MVLLNRDVRGRHVARCGSTGRRATAEVVAYLAGSVTAASRWSSPPRQAPLRQSRGLVRPRPAARGLGCRHPALIFRDSISIDGGHQAGPRLLALSDRPPPRSATATRWPSASCRRAPSAAVGVPRDLSVVGWDDVPYARLVTPPLTTVRVPRYELGQAAARELLDLIAGRPAGPPRPRCRSS